MTDVARAHKRAPRALSGVVAFLLAAGCAGLSSGGGNNGNEPGPGALSGGANGHLVASDYGDQWPLTVPSADVHCYPSAGGYDDVTVTINGTEYAVNGTARQSGQWPDFNGSGYWRKDPEFKGLKVSIGPVIDAGLAMC